MSIPKRTCTGCFKTKNLTKFGKDKTHSNGRQSRCKNCCNKYRREHYKTEIIPDTTRFKTAKSIAGRKGQVWEFTFEEWSLLVLGDDKRCSYCLGPLPVGGSALDRMDSSKGYIKGNVTPCCKKCNGLKSDAYSYEEFMAVMELLRKMRGLPEDAILVLTKSTKIPKKIIYPARKLTPRTKTEDLPVSKSVPTIESITLPDDIAKAFLWD